MSTPQIEAEHTPGDWYLANNSEPLETEQCTVPTYEVCSTESTFWIAEVMDTGDGLGKANARLIAAAPDLLAACEVAARHLNLSTTSAKELKQQIRAAIAKAKGGS